MWPPFKSDHGLLALFERLLRLYLRIHAFTYFRVPIKVPATLSEHCTHWFKNTMKELLKTSTDPRILKGVNALKQLFLKRRRIQFPIAVAASKNACPSNPLRPR